MSEVEEIPEELVHLINEIVPMVEEGKIVILHEIYRSSEGYYNWKSNRLIVIRKYRVSRYEDTDVREIEILPVSTGVFETLSTYDVNDLIEILERDCGYLVDVVRIY